MKKWTRRVLSALLACVLVGGITPMLPPLTANATSVTVSARTFDAGWGLVGIMSNGNISVSDYGSPYFLNDSSFGNKIVQLTGISDAIEVSVGPEINAFSQNNSRYVLRSDKTVWAYGGDYSESKFTKVADNIIHISGKYAINASNNLVELGSTKVIMSGVADVTRDGSYALKTDGTVYHVGNNSPIMNGVVQISGGSYGDYNDELYALKSNNELYVFGRSPLNYNNAGTLHASRVGYVFATPERIATNVSAFSSGVFGLLVKETNNTMWHWDWDYFWTFGNRKQINIGNDVASFSCADGRYSGNAYAVYVTSNGSVYTFDNTYKPVKLMDGIRVPESTTVGPVGDGTLTYEGFSRKWDESLFSPNPNAKSYPGSSEWKELAMVSGILSGISYGGKKEPLLNAFRNIGCLNVKDSDFYNETSGFWLPGYAFGHKKIVRNGQSKDLVIAIFRGTDQSIDWASDLTHFLGGISISAVAAYTRLSEYLIANKINMNDAVFLVAGHSMGGAMANYVANALSDTVSNSNVFAFTFSGPKTAITNLKPHENISNFLSVTDTCIFVGPAFHTCRYGRNYYVSTPVTFLGGGTSHALSSYLLAIRNMTGTGETPPWHHYLLVQCPVDIEVYDSNNTLVGKITNNTVSESTIVPAWVEGDDKWLVLSSEEKFSIKLVGTDTGTMDYTVYGYDFETESITQTKAYTNVTLENGKRFTSEVDALAGVAEVPLFVADVNGNPVREVLQDGTEIPCSATKFVSLFNWQTKYESNFWNWFKFIVLFGWIWMWFI